MTVIVALLRVVVHPVHLGLSRVSRTRIRVIRVLLIYASLFGVGVTGLLLGFIPNVFFADQTAHLAAWKTVSIRGCARRRLGVLGSLCFWPGDLF
jgi:hypothetical protein